MWQRNLLKIKTAEQIFITDYSIRWQCKLSKKNVITIEVNVKKKWQGTEESRNIGNYVRARRGIPEQDYNKEKQDV